MQKLVLSGVVLSFLLFLRSSLPAEQTPLTPAAQDRQVARLVAMMMKREHLSKHPLDDEISRRALDQFLKSVDPRKLYFYQSDVDEFYQRRNEIDDMINNGDVNFAYTVFTRLLKRVDERMA